MTYLRTWGAGSPGRVQDAFSRLVDGRAHALGAGSQSLQIAIARRGPKPRLIHNSDQGSQYVFLAFGQVAQ